MTTRISHTRLCAAENGHGSRGILHHQPNPPVPQKFKNFLQRLNDVYWAEVLVEVR
jgi:hypothetical protein